MHPTDQMSTTKHQVIKTSRRPHSSFFKLPPTQRHTQLVNGSFCNILNPTPPEQSFPKLSHRQGLTEAGLLFWAPGEALPGTLTFSCSPSSVGQAEPHASDSQAEGYLVPLLERVGWKKVTRNLISLPSTGNNRSPQSCVSQSGRHLNKSEAKLFQMTGTNFQTFFKQVNVISFFLANLSKAKFERALILLE